MDAQAVYRKSEKGTEAIATRGYGVAGKLRMLLILVDGKKTGAELIQLAAGMGESVQLVQQLMDQGLIEAAAMAPGSQPAATVAPQAKPATAVADLAKLKSLTARLLIEQLGPTGDALALKVEAAKNIDEFIETVKRAYAVVRDVKGQASADKFGAEIESQMPPG